MRCWIIAAGFLVLISIFAGWREWHWRALDAESTHREFADRQAIAEKVSEKQSLQQKIEQWQSDHRALQETLENEQARIEHRDTLVNMWQSRFRSMETSASELQQGRDQLAEELRNERSERIVERRRHQEQTAGQTAELESELALCRSAWQQTSERLQSYPFQHQKIALHAVAGNGRAFAIERQSIADLPQNRRLLVFRGQQFMGTAHRAEYSPTHWLLHFSPDRTLRDPLKKGDFLSIVWTSES